MVKLRGEHGHAEEAGGDDGVDRGAEFFVDQGADEPGGNGVEGGDSGERDHAVADGNEVDAAGELAAWFGFLAGGGEEAGLEILHEDDAEHARGDHGDVAGEGEVAGFLDAEAAGDNPAVHRGHQPAGEGEKDEEGAFVNGGELGRGGGFGRAIFVEQIQGGAGEEGGVEAEAGFEGEERATGEEVEQGRQKTAREGGDGADGEIGPVGAFGLETGLGEEAGAEERGGGEERGPEAEEAGGVHREGGGEGGDDEPGEFAGGGAQDFAEEGAAVGRVGPVAGGEFDQPGVDDPHAERGEGDEDAERSVIGRRDEQGGDLYADDATEKADALAERDRQEAIAEGGGGEFHAGGGGVRRKI